MKLKVLFLGCTAITVGIATLVADATQSFAQINELVVSARQRDEAVTDVPATVSVFTSETIQRAGIERAEDFINLTAGVTLVDAAEVGDTQVNIRGINGARDAENSFAFIVDGVLMTNPAAFNREFSNLSQIEVVKGPQGAIYGRNAAAGAIIINTNKPGNEFEGQAKFSVGNRDTFLASGYVGGPIVEDRLFFQLGGDWRDTDGFQDNIFLGDDVVDDYEGFNVNGRLVFEPTDTISIDTKVRYGEVDAAAISFNSAFALPAFEATGGFGDVNDYDFIFSNNIDPINEQEALEASVKLDWDLDFATLTGWVLYSDIENDFLTDGTSGAFGFFASEASCAASAAAITTLSDPGLYSPPTFNFGDGVPVLLGGSSFLGAYTPTTCDGYQYQVRNQEDVSVELRLTSPSDQRLRWSVGTYYLDLEREVGVATGIDDTFLGGTIARDLLDADVEQLVYDQFDSEVFALFGQLNYDVTEAIELSLALRWDREERKVRNLVPTDRTTRFIDFDLSADTNGNGILWDDGGSPLNPGLNPLINPSGTIADKEETFEQWQPKLSVTWDLNEEWTTYANWGIGFKSGGFNNQGSAATIDLFINDFIANVYGSTQAPVNVSDVFEKETSSAFEVGFKSSLLGGDLTFDGAVYHTRVDDMQFFEFFVGPFGLLRVVNNIDEVEITGVELGANWRVNDNWQIYANGNYIDSEIKENNVRPDTVGNDAPYTAEYTFNLGVQYEQPIANTDADFVARADFQYVGPTWFHTVQDQTRTVQAGDAVAGFGFVGDYSRTERDSYHTLDLRLGVETENWSLTAYGKNITDEEYLEEIIPAPEFGGAFIHPAAERAFGVEAVFRF